jgi:hypothetical protein
VLGLVWALELKPENSEWLDCEVEAPLIEEAVHRVLALKHQDLRPSAQLAHDSLTAAIHKRKSTEKRRATDCGAKEIPFLPRLIVWRSRSAEVYPPQPADFFQQFEALTAEYKVVLSNLLLSQDTRVLHATHFKDFISMIKASGSGLKIKANCSRREQYAHTPLCWFRVDLESGNSKAFQEAFKNKICTHTCVGFYLLLIPLTDLWRPDTLNNALRLSKEHRFGSVLLSLPLSVIYPDSAQLYDLGVRFYASEISQTLLVDRHTTDSPSFLRSSRARVLFLTPLSDT